MSRMLRLSKGFIPIQIDYFEATGDSALSLYIEESPDKRTSAENIFYHEAPAEKDLNQNEIHNRTPLDVHTNKSTPRDEIILKQDKGKVVVNIDGKHSLNIYMRTMAGPNRCSIR